MRKTLSVFMVFCGVALVCFTSFAEPGSWQMLDEGLSLGSFLPPRQYRMLDSPIALLKIDPQFYSFRLLSASEHGGIPRTAQQWCTEFSLLAATNASMYQNEDPLKSTGYMKNYEHVNNPRINPSFGAFMVFNPINSSYPEVQFVDRRRQRNWTRLLQRYHTVIQNYRMISEGKKTGWPQQGKSYSIAAIGLDKNKNALFIYSRSPFSTHDFIHILLALPIQINNAMYLEGGPEATLHINLKDHSLKRKRSYAISSTAYENDKSPLKIPNVIGIVKRK